MQTQTSSWREGKQNKRTEQNSSSQTICSCDNRAGRDGSQGCFVPFAGCLQLALHLALQAGFSLGPSLPVSPWQCGTQRPPGWSFLRFFSSGGCEFSICIHAHTTVFYPVARLHYRFIHSLHFAVLQLSASQVSLTSLQWAHVILPVPRCITSLLFTPKIRICMPYLEGKNTALESRCLGVEQANMAKAYILEGSCKPPWA